MLRRLTERCHVTEAKAPSPTASIWLCAKGFYYHQKCNCTVVVEGQRTGGKRIRLRDIKYVPSINAEPTSLLYISPPVSVTSLHDGAIVSL